MSTMPQKKIDTEGSLSGRMQAPADIDGRLSALPEWNHRVLVVEDEHGIAEAYRDILSPRSQGVIPIRRSSRSAPTEEPTKAPERFELVVVHDAEAAIAEVKRSMSMKKPFTMGFFDVLLGGGMDGIELVKKIHELDPHLYAVFVTAYSDRNVDSIQALLGEEHASRWDYLNKPFTQGEILQKARNGVALWNLTREKQIKDEHMANLQRQLLEHERLATMATVARGIGHEFRNILTSIMGKAELSETLNTMDALREQMKNILQASHRAADVLQRFHFLHNPSEQKIQKKWMFIDQPIEEALTLLSHQIKTNNVRVCWIRRKKSLVFGNETGLMQVFVNLTLNAMQAMGSSGQIDISIVEIADRIEVRFRDYGPGADKKIIDRLCEPFFTTKGEQGTGLGLAIAKEIIEVEHEGKLTIQNHEVKGLEILMVFPLTTTPTGGDKKGG